jgi:hypothetical protein
MPCGSLTDVTELSGDLLASSMAVSRFPPIRAGYSKINSYRFDQFYDLKRPARVDLRRRRLLDLLIHSLEFVEVVGEAKT